MYRRRKIPIDSGATLKCMDLLYQKLGLRPTSASKRRREKTSRDTAYGALLAIGLLTGCASPGPPRSPSLNLPQPVSDLVVSRTGNLIELSFTIPHLSTDKLPLFDAHHHKPTSLNGTICRELKPAPCVPVGNIAPILTAVDHAMFTWHETLPENLSDGPPHLLSYRVEFVNRSGKSAGKSNAAYTAAGSAPVAVVDLHAQGTRGGVLLQWQRDLSTAEILLHRIDLAPKSTTTSTKTKMPVVSSAKANDLWLNANSSQARTLDASVTANVPYRYTAVRRVLLTLDRHRVEVQSEFSPAVDFTLNQMYAPASPTGLYATGFTPPDGSHFAVDLIWQPVSDAGVTPALAAPLAGYNVYREPLDGSGTKTRLTSTPMPQPSFHDVTAEPKVRYRYSVTAIDGNGNESGAATLMLGTVTR
jgi:hypothetical protein